jgi:hypothetical protein
MVVAARHQYRDLRHEKSDSGIDFDPERIKLISSFHEFFERAARSMNLWFLGHLPSFWLLLLEEVLKVIALKTLM